MHKVLCRLNNQIKIEVTHLSTSYFAFKNTHYNDKTNTLQKSPI